MKDLFDYDGVNLIKKFGSRGIGKPCGILRKDNGYKVITVNGKYMYVHRIIWELVRGPIPEGMQIDHINGIKHDNRIENLRCVSVDDNMRNRCQSKRRLPGVTGVTYSKKTPTKPWKVMIYNKNKHMNLGYFANFVDACEARIVAEVKLGYHSNHGLRKNPSTI